MAHFAKLDENNTVLSVHVVNNDVINVDGVESEQAGIDFLIETHGHPYWKQCSYNASFRKHYPGEGWTYDISFDAFIPPKVYESWTLDETKCVWNPPIEYPNDGKTYQWNESTQSWDERTSL